jgi:hypothetical protein
LVALPLDQFNQNGRIYLAIDTANGTAIMGAALTWPVLDNFGRNVGPVNFFPGFNITDGVRGIAGIFASHYPNQNGVAVFADVSEWLKNSRRGTYQPSVDGQVIFLK